MFYQIIISNLCYLLSIYNINIKWSYPGTLSGSEVDCGRDYSSMSKVFNTCLDFLYDIHKDKVIGNIAWYQDRFDLYNEVLFIKLLTLFYVIIIFNY